MLYCYMLLWDLKKTIKGLLNSWRQSPGKMMLLHGINDHILIPNMYFLGVYQRKKNLHKDINNVFGLEQIPPKTDKTAMLVYTTTLRIKRKYIPLRNWVGAGCSGLIIIFGIKYWWINVHHKMGAFSSFLWRLLVTLCTVSSRTSPLWCSKDIFTTDFVKWKWNIIYGFTIGFIICSLVYQILRHSQEKCLNKRKKP